MYYYDYNSILAASPLDSLPLERAPEGRPALFLTGWDPWTGPAAYRPRSCRQLSAKAADIAWLTLPVSLRKRWSRPRRSAPPFWKED